MKNKYIVYEILGEKVKLFTNQTGYQSGYVFEEKPDDHGLEIIGQIDVYEAGSFKERVFVCKIVIPIDGEGLFSKYFPVAILRGPVWFFLKIPPLKEMTILQQRALTLAIENKPFKQNLYFKDKTRISLLEES